MYFKNRNKTEGLKELSFPDFYARIYGNIVFVGKVLKEVSYSPFGVVIQDTNEDLPLVIGFKVTMDALLLSVRKAY